MKRTSPRSSGMSLRLFSTIGLVAALAACGASESPTTPAIDISAQLAHVSGPPGTVTLCKYTVEPTDQIFDFQVEATGGQVPGNGHFSLAATQTVEVGPECAVVWATRGDGVQTVTITEDVPLGWVLFRIVDTETGEHPVDDATAQLEVNETSAVTVFFKNAPTDIDMTPGRMTGGGGQIAIGDVNITRGFTIHCDITLSNNLQIVWHDDVDQWHIDKPLTSAVCLANGDPTPPAAPFNTFIGEGVGRLNGVDGSIVRFVFVDNGEPGRNDQAEIRIWAPGDDPDVDDPVKAVPLSNLDRGNIQAHYDQPHK